MFKKLLFSGPERNSRWIDGGMFLLRVFAGLAMAFGHGIGKIPPSDGFIEGVGKLGFPLPVLFTWAASLSEFAGGLLLAAGLITRPAAFFLAITMFVAAFMRHADDPFSTKEKALLYAFIALLYFFAGPGRYSLDALIGKNKVNG